MSSELEVVPFSEEPEEGPEPQVDEPVDLRPDLGELLGIVEVERGVCEDTFENRAILRKAKFTFRPVYDQYGRATGLITAVSPESERERRLTSLAEKRPILVNPDDNNSDYLTGVDLLLESKVDYLVPAWVLGATKAWVSQQENGGVPLPGRRKATGLPHRCRQIKTDGIRCLLWSSGRFKDDGLCRIHLRVVRKPGDDVERARAKLVQAAPYAVDVLEELMFDAESEPVRLKASTEILDRAGVRGGQDFNIDVEVSDNRPASEVVKDRLSRLAAGALVMQERLDRLEDGAAPQEIEDAEIVEESDGAVDHNDGEIETTASTEEPSSDAELNGDFDDDLEAESRS